MLSKCCPFISIAMGNYMNMLELKQKDSLAKALPVVANNVKCDTQMAWWH